MTPLQERFAAALELRELTIEMHRQQLQREHPQESSEEIERRLRAWVLAPGPGEPRSLQRSRYTG